MSERKRKRFSKQYLAREARKRRQADNARRNLLAVLLPRRRTRLLLGRLSLRLEAEKRRRAVPA